VGSRACSLLVCGALASCTSSSGNEPVLSESGGAAGSGGDAPQQGGSATQPGGTSNAGGGEASGSAGQAVKDAAIDTPTDGTIASGVDAAPDAGVGLGPFAISANHRYFIDDAGKPCFWLGDTQWDLFVAFSQADAQSLLQNRHDKGFNAVRVMILGVGGGKRANAAGAKPFTNDVVATPNEAYFAAVDAIVKAAEKVGIMLVIGIYHQGADYSTLITQQNARAWATWVGSRYRASRNVIWSMYPQATAAFVPIVRELAAGLAAGDGGSHMITVHPDPSPTSSSWIQGETWLTFNTLQSWSSAYLNFQMVNADYALTPVKVVVNGEARYEAEDGTTPLMVRNGAYWSILAGGFYTYGHAGDWQNPTGYKAWMDSPGSQQMKIMGTFFRGVRFQDLVPDQGVLGDTPGQNVAARSSQRAWGIVYLPAGGQVSVKLANAVATPMADVSWMNPETGAVEMKGAVATTGTQVFAAPAGWSDALLVLKELK